MNKTPQPNTDPAYLESQGLSPTILGRFLSKIEIDPVTGCWNWIACLHDGYGIMSRGKKVAPPIKAANAAWILWVGPIPKGKEILHKCPNGANKRCANPGHLACDTHAANMKDERGEKWHRHHQFFPRGEMASTPKLTQKQVDEIRSKYTGKRGEQSQLAREYGVRQGTIWYVLNHLTW